MPASRRFEFAFERRYERAARLFGVTPTTAWVDLTEHTLVARFGPWHVETELGNVSAVAVTGPYLFVKTAGPARLAVTDRGLTFATNSRRGVCLEFAEPIRGIDPLGVIRHPNLTLTVADADELASALRVRPAAP